MSDSVSSLFERWFLRVLFAAALVYSVYAVTFNWTMGFMPGHEFRQAQTAITSYYIDKDNNFGLLYETPILGKPWVSILLEVPIYEWSVVGLSRATGWSHVVCARTVSATCFYLTLPALWLLFARMGLSPTRRLLPLSLVLCGPAYIFYSRSFLMDSMAFMGSVWWLAAFVRAMDGRRWGWLLVAVVAGSLGALVKSAIFAVWLIPGVAYGAWLLWRDLRAGDGWRRPLATVLWGAGTVVVALGLLKAWIAYSDPIKAAHPSAWIFTSKNLSEGNWGLFDPRPLFSKDLWRQLLHCWEQAIMSRWVIAVGLVAGLFFPKMRWRVLGAAALFFAGQFLFPFAFAYQDYYFYMSAVFVLAALGFTLLGVLDSRLPRWAVVVIFAVPFTAEVVAYWRDYRQSQGVWHQGGYPFTAALRDLTPKNTVLIVAGADWAAMTPLYAQRKALMIRNGLQFDGAYLDRAYKALADENVAALVVFNEMRQDRNFIERTTGRFDMDMSQPTFSWAFADIYVSRLYAKGIQVALKNSTARYPDITLPKELPEDPKEKGLVRLNASAARETFFNITPAPYQIRFEFGVGWLTSNNQTVLSAHPNSELWIEPPAGAKRIEWVFGFFPGAYEKPGSQTNGVEFSIVGELPNGETRRVYRRLVEPASNMADRGDLREVIAYEPLPGEKLKFSTGPMGSSAFDWAYIVSIKIE